MSAYTLKKHKESGELHLFKGKFNSTSSESKCSSGKLSICEKMLKTDSGGNKFTCLDESDARNECATIGRSVCGVCVSHLYASAE